MLGSINYRLAVDEFAGMLYRSTLVHLYAESLQDEADGGEPRTFNQWLEDVSADHNGTVYVTSDPVKALQMAELTCHDESGDSDCGWGRHSDECDMRAATEADVIDWSAYRF